MNADELKAKLDILREYGLLERVHSIGEEVVLFPIAKPAAALSAEDRAKLANAREESAEAAEDRRRFGAAGGMRPGRVSLEDVQHRGQVEEQELARWRRQNERARAARAELDAKQGTG